MYWKNGMYVQWRFHSFFGRKYMEKMQDISHTALKIGQKGKTYFSFFAAIKQLQPKMLWKRKQALFLSWNYLKKKNRRKSLLQGVHLWRTKAKLFESCAKVARSQLCIQMQFGTILALLKILERILQEHLIRGQIVEEFRIILLLLCYYLAAPRKIIELKPIASSKKNIA